jgi:hypothetical protein
MIGGTPNARPLIATKRYDDSCDATAASSRANAVLSRRARRRWMNATTCPRSAWTHS